MVGNTNLFVITKIWWERIFLHIEILASRQDASFYLKNPGYAPIKLESRQEEGCTFLTLNITCVSERSFLENGRWQIAAVSADGTETLCTIDAHTSYQLDSLSRTFRYAQDQMAYTMTFGVASEDDANLIFYLDSYFMIENRRWRQRRYVREVRTAKEKTKRFFMYAAILMIRCYYHMLYALTPKNGTRVMIMSETKDVLWGNLKYIDTRIKERNLDQKFKITYSYRSAAGKHQSGKDIFSWMKVVTKIARQDVIFVDDYAPVFGFFKLGRKTKLIQVWHAGEGFKSVGYSRFGKDGSPFPDGSCHKQYTHVITGSEHLIDVFHEVFGIEKDAFYPVGMPRMDGFLDPEVIDEFKDDFYTKYPELQEKKIILFAPTYRGTEQKYAYYDYSKLDFQRIYEFCQKEDAVFLIKMHPFVKTLPEIPELLQDRIREFSRFPDINKLYYVTDLLITDYSSNYFEYALLQRPVVFYTYDREFYELTRGVHRSILESAPGKVCDTFDQLMECLEQKDFETEKIIQFAKDNFGGYRGDASDRVIDEILLQEE